MQYKMDMIGGIIRVTFSGTLTKHDLVELVQRGIGKSTVITPNWLFDLRALTQMDIDFVAVSELARVLLGRALPHTVKAAILVSNSIQHGFARMLQILLDHPQVEVKVFEDEMFALDWLSNQAK